MKLFGEPLELLILDVDGTILDLLAFFWQHLEEAAVKSGYELEPIKKYQEDVRNGTSGHKASFTEMLHAFYPNRAPEDNRVFFEKFRELEKANPYPPIDGSIEAILWFRERGLSLALCTTNEKPALDHRLASAGIDPTWFSAISDWENGFRKPDPRALEPIFRNVPVSKGRAAYVGDWFPDVELAQRAGVKFIAVLSGGISKEAFLKKGVSTSHILKRLSELPKLIEE